MVVIGELSSTGHVIILPSRKRIKKQSLLFLKHVHTKIWLVDHKYFIIETEIYNAM